MPRALEIPESDFWDLRVFDSNSHFHVHHYDVFKRSICRPHAKFLTEDGFRKTTGDNILLKRILSCIKM